MGVKCFWICLVKSEVIIVRDRHSIRALVAVPAGGSNRLLYYPQEKAHLPGRNDRQRPLSRLRDAMRLWPVNKFLLDYMFISLALARHRLRARRLPC